jgi:hypothetical protein
MKAIARFTSIACGLSVAGLAHAQAAISDATLRDFAKCDASFFRALGKEKAGWGAVATMGERGEIRWFRVARRNNGEYNSWKRDNEVVFSPMPATVPGRISLRSYFDQAVDAGMGSLEAKSTFPNLTGRAVKLSCLYFADKLDATVELAFLEDLGIAIRTGYESLTLGSLQHTAFVRFDIER